MHCPLHLSKGGTGSNDKPSDGWVAGRGGELETCEKVTGRRLMGGRRFHTLDETQWRSNRRLCSLVFTASRCKRVQRLGRVFQLNQRTMKETAL